MKLVWNEMQRLYQSYLLEKETRNAFALDTILFSLKIRDVNETH